MKKDRQARIIELIDSTNIETQEDLVNRLKAEGYDVTQATVSRDIRKLNLTKISLPGGHQKYARINHEAAYADKYSRILKDAYVSMEQAQNIIVIKTVGGMAMAAAAALDAMHLPGFVGCIAGDDTIMVAGKTTDDTTSLFGEIKSIVV